MNIMTALEQELNPNVSVTENGAIGYKTTGKALLDLNFAIPTLRKADDNVIMQLFNEAANENIELAMKWLFFVRDIREGMGERRLFRIIMREFSKIQPTVIKKLIQYIPEYGRWDDIFVFFEDGVSLICKDEATRVIRLQFYKDLVNMQNNKSVSLLAKWLPSVQTKNVFKRKVVKHFLKNMGMTEKEYRKKLSNLRSYLDIVERKMCHNQWDKIVYEYVPSKANLIYNNAFYLHDADRRAKYLSSLRQGKTKINANAIYPHEIIHKYRESDYSREKINITYEEMWKTLDDVVQGQDNTMVVADGSGSMYWCNTSNYVSPIDVAMGLAIYFSERSSGVFKNKFITFSENPVMVDLTKCLTLKDKMTQAYSHNEIANTNIEAVFQKILNLAITHKAPQSDLPQTVLVISDMEFDESTTAPVNIALFEKIKKDYQQAGYTLPRLVFWNVGGRTKTIPLIENEAGVCLISGYSPVACEMVLSSELDAYQCLVKRLISDRYSKIVV